MSMRPLLMLPLLLACTFASPQLDPILYEGLKWRSIGPLRGGRSVAATGVAQRPKEYYFGATGGGVWKTTDGGVEWNCVSDGFLGTASVGALAVAPSNPDVVYAGTGEKDIRGNISHGDGLYRSDDAGKTWRHIGLRECQTISRIVVHPRDPDTAWVAALGHVYVKRDIATGRVDADPNRGIYKTTDGGKTWARVLFKSPTAGGIDVEIDPSNPQTLYAALWEAWRTPYTLNSGGPGSGLHKSTDGGKTWTDLTRNTGLPQGVIGKIGLAVSPANPKRLYAIVEALDGGIFRSDDAGATWILANSGRQWRQRAWYYSHVIADTKDADAVWVLNVGVGRSTDGGKTFRGVSTPHSDSHDLWIAPDDPNRIIEANDGGANVSTDGGRTWTDQDFATGQFYHVTTDNAFPYRVLGAQQDNSTVRIPSRDRGGGGRRGRGAGIDIESTAGGESGYIAVKPNDPDVVFGGSYGGYLERLNHRTGKGRNVNVWPDNPMGHGAIDLRQRFQWTFPIVFSPHDPNLLYTCSQHVWKSTNEGETWTKISPDLSRNDPRTLGPSGGPITKDNTSVEYYGTVFTLAESPSRPGVLWAGSDDGLVHVSRDAGASWQNVTPKEMPEWGLCSMIEASPFEEGTAYLAVDNHENDDLAPYVFVTRNFGRTWNKLVEGLPSNAFVRVVREDPARAGLLYAGTEVGVFVRFPGEKVWQSLGMNLPLTPIHDLVVKEGDLVVATHGRGFWILDDISPLRQISADAAAARLFAPRPATMANFRAPAPNGILANYFLPKDAEKVEFELFDTNGVAVAKTEGVGKKGLNRVSLAPRYPGYRGFPGMILWGAGSQQIPGAPGVYRLKLTVDGQVKWADAEWKRDPRAECSDDDLRARTEFALLIRDRMNDANGAVIRIRELKKALDDTAKAKPGVARQAEALKVKLSSLEEEIYQVRNQSGQDPLNYPIKLNNRIGALLGVVLGGEARPTDASYQVFAELTGMLQIQLDRLKELEVEVKRLLA
ncbi:MAG TPA: hypothetical protein PLL78_07255 [Fimbriimonadaceae bacterium]|nr:hypothetical protein [Fimbriimonadaceae bacterium]HRJ96469.1 hypothetical protein [Fimbriimonadaceae bacterium]